jgi:hypothetical protein
MKTRAADKKMTMKKVHTANGYDFYAGDYDGKKFYNIVPVGQSAPEGGYASKGYIEHIKHVKFPVEAAAKPKYDPNTSYERENLERIAKEWAKFCKDTEKQNPGRHDFRIWMEQNYPRITVLDALKQMAMDAVWGKAEPYRSPSNGEPEHQADHYQKRVGGDKDKKEKTEAAKIDRVWVVLYPGPKSTLKDILFAANVAELQKLFAGGLSPKDVFGMYDNQKEAKGHADSLLSALPGKIEGMMRAKAQEEPEKPHTPHFKLVALDETEYWSDSVFKDFPEIKAIYGIYIFDETLGVHMAELTPSHELWFVDHYLTYTDDFMDKFRDSDENVSEEAKERMIEIEDYIRDNADYSERVTYKHASAIRGMGAEYIQDIGEGVSTEEDDYESQMEDAIEHENGNPHGWDALDKKPASDPRVRTDKDMQRENRPATEDEPQTTIYNFARRVRATRIKGNWKAKAGGKTTAMRTKADSDDEGGDLRTELTEEDGMAIIDKIQNTPDMQDHDFHEFVEGMGIKPSAAETFAYGLLYDLLNEGPQPEPVPQMEIGADGKRKK